jgi:hypothetical protein
MVQLRYPKATELPKQLTGVEVMYLVSDLGRLYSSDLLIGPGSDLCAISLLAQASGTKYNIGCFLRSII